MGGNIRLKEGELYRFGNALLLALLVLFGAGELLGVEQPGVWHMLIVLGVLLLLLAANFLSGRKKWFFLLSVLICAGMVVVTVGIKNVAFFLQAYLRWLVGGDRSVIGGEESLLTELHQENGAVKSFLKGYGLLQTAWITAVCYFLQMLLERVPVLKKGLAIVLLIGLVFALFAQSEIEQPGVVFFIGYLLTVVIEGIEGHWKKVRKRNKKAYMVWMAPFLAGYLLLLFSMPVPKEPYDWGWVENLYYKIKETFVTAAQDAIRGDKEDFGMAFSGFSGEGELQEGVREEAQSVMSIKSKDSLRTNLYLAGRVYDTFDGTQWQQEAEGFLQERFLDTLETLYAARGFDELHMRDYLGRTSLTLRYGYFNTQYVFQPLKLWELKGSKRLEYSDLGGSLVWDRQRGYGTEYQMEYFQLNLGQPEFLRFLEAAETTEVTGEVTRGTGDPLWNQVLAEYERRMGERTDKETIEAYQQYVYATYLPEAKWTGSLSEEGRVRVYLTDLTEGCQTRVSTLLAIEQELSALRYTRTPGAMPETVTDEESFLDYFLLESRQGYCTYFATAFVLLARAAGLPARYVEGFLVPARDTAQYGSDGELLVYSSMAHAWPEVYLDGIGWIPFEPTPGYSGMRYTPWSTAQTEAGSNPYGAGGDGKDGQGTDGRNEEENDSGYLTSNLVGEEEASEGEIEDMEEETENGEEGKRGFLARLWNWETAKRLLGMCSLALAAVLFGGIALLLGDALIWHFRYRRMDAAGKLKVNLSLNLQILAWLERELGEKQSGGRVKPRRAKQSGGKWNEEALGYQTETLQELREKGRALLEAESVWLPLCFIEDYEEVLYGGRTVREEMLVEAAGERRELLDLLKRKMGWRYMLYWLKLFPALAAV